MIKKQWLIVFSLLLYGCAGQKQEPVYSEYSSCSCGELNWKYREVLSRRVNAFNKRMKENDGNIIGGAVIGIFSGGGNSKLNEASTSEEEAEGRLKALRNYMRHKKCDVYVSQSVNRGESK